MQINKIQSYGNSLVNNRAVANNHNAQTNPSFGKIPVELAHNELNGLDAILCLCALDVLLTLTRHRSNPSNTSTNVQVTNTLQVEPKTGQKKTNYNDYKNKLCLASEEDVKYLYEKDIPAEYAVKFYNYMQVAHNNIVQMALEENRTYDCVEYDDMPSIAKDIGAFYEAGYVPEQAEPFLLEIYKRDRLYTSEFDINRHTSYQYMHVGHRFTLSDAYKLIKNGISFDDIAYDARTMVDIYENKSYDRYGGTSDGYVRHDIKYSTNDLILRYKERVDGSKSIAST
ncbi:MAG: hypothetical protein MJ231_02425, partial [bacterium]|nr:hypothetical protein [bacterium]